MRIIPKPKQGQTWTQAVLASMKLACATQGNILDLSSVPIGTVLPDFELSHPDRYLSLEVVGGGHWSWFVGDLKFRDLKDGRLSRFSTVGNVLFDTSPGGSSSRNIVEQVHCQSGGFRWTAPGGADSCLTTVRHCTAAGATTGFKIIGANALSFLFEMCGGVDCETVFDLREGGSGSVFRQCVSSDCQKMFWLNGGYVGYIDAAESERCGTVVEIGGDTAAGFGQTTPYRIHMIDARDVGFALAAVNKAGTVTIDVENVKGIPRPVVCTNKNTVPLVLNLTGTTLVQVIEGHVTVNGTVVT